MTEAVQATTFYSLIVMGIFLVLLQTLISFDALSTGPLDTNQHFISSVLFDMLFYDPCSALGAN